MSESAVIPSKVQRYRTRMTPELVTALNRQINLELKASYFYLVLSTVFGQSSFALPGFQSFFAKESKEERDHAQRLLDYQVMRGHALNFEDIRLGESFKLPESAQDAVSMSYELEVEVTDHIYHLLDLADQAEDHHIEEFLQDFLKHQLQAIYELECLTTQLKRVGNADGLYSLDVELQK